MGGRAFAKRVPPIETPRMCPADYRDFHDMMLKAFAFEYERVAIPIEGPAKDTYGDVDILATGLRPVSPASEQSAESEYPELLIEIAGSREELKKILATPLNLSGSYAVPVESLAKPKCNHPPIDRSKHVQLDLRVLDHDDFVWKFFMDSHGDLWNMLGPSLRQKGLVMTDCGLCAIHPTIEPIDKKQGRIPLSREPIDVLKFLGLDVDTFWGRDRTNLPWSGEWVDDPDSTEVDLSDKMIGHPFYTEEDLFAFVCSSPFFAPSAYIRRENLKSKERRRLATRATFRRFVKDYVPNRYPDAMIPVTEEAPDDHTFEGTNLTMVERTEGIFAPEGEPECRVHRSATSQARTEERNRIAQEALQHFDKHDEWNAREEVFLSQRRAWMVKNAVKDLRHGDVWYGERYIVSWRKWLQERMHTNNEP